MFFSLGVRKRSQRAQFRIGECQKNRTRVRCSHRIPEILNLILVWHELRNETKKRERKEKKRNEILDPNQFSVFHDKLKKRKKNKR